MCRRALRFKPEYCEGRFTLSRRLRMRIRKHPVSAYRIGIASGYLPTTFYRICNGMSPVDITDPRLAKLAEIMDLPLDVCYVPFGEWGK